MFNPGDIISYIDMCKAEGVNLQHGMNYRLRGGASVILMSLRPNAPYADRLEADGRILIYEGHDVPLRKGGPDPKVVNQEMRNPGGSLTRNGLFYEAAKRAEGGAAPELVRVYEKIRPGIWAFNGHFFLLSVEIERDDKRSVFKFRLELRNIDAPNQVNPTDLTLRNDRVIPSHTKLEVWKRDKGRCIQCGSQDNLHFDHILPFSKGGSSVLASNIQILCARHNLMKRDKIE